MFFLIFLLLCVKSNKQQIVASAQVKTALNMALEVTVSELKGNTKNTAHGYGMVGKFIDEMANGKQKNQEELKSIMKEICAKLNKMNNEVTQRTTLTNFTLDDYFHAMIKTPILRLIGYMERAITDPSQKNLDQFKRDCEQKSPHGIAMDFEIYLSDKKTNPFIFAMEADELKSNTTYNDWKLTVSYLMSSCARLEGMFEGLQGFNVLEIEKNLNDIEQKYGNIIEIVDRTADNYGKTYWPTTVQNLIDKTLKNNKYESHRTVVNQLKDNLREIYTQDEFLIFVYDDARKSRVNAFANVENQLLCVSAEGKRCACVYRSMKYKVENIEVLQKEMQSFFHDEWEGHDLRHVLWKTAEQIFDQMNGLTGMIALIASEYHIVFDATLNGTRFPFGPVWIVPATVNRESIIVDWHPKTDVYFFAALP